MSSPASFAEIVDALRQAEAGLEVAVAHKPQTTGFVPSHVLALQIVKGVLERLPTEAAAMAATVPASPHRPSPEWYATMIQSTADDDFQVGPAFVAAPKDHEIAALVNKLRDVAIEFHGAQQLRVRIAEIVVPALKVMQAPVAGQPAEPSPADLAKLAARIKEHASHWAYMTEIDNGDAADVARAKHAELLDELVALAAPKGDSNG